MGQIKSYEDLVAWQHAMDVCALVYESTRGFPDEERYGLVSQMRRCAVSIPSNIAEGYGRGRTGDYLRFLRIARGSAYELDTQIKLALRFGFFNEDVGTPICDEVRRCSALVGGLVRSIERRATN